MEKKLKVVITGGGTAGHVTPAIEIGERLKENYGAELFYIGNKNYIEFDIASSKSIPFYHTSSKGMEGKGLLDRVFKFIKTNGKGVKEALSVLRALKPDLIVSTGGFVTAPVLTAAKLLRIPFYIHEQNTVMGRVNKLFAKKAKRLFLSFEKTSNVPNNTKSLVVGNPVGINERLAPGEKLLVLGGSGGSAFLNDWALNFSEKFPEIPMILVTGKNEYQRVINKSSNMLESNIDLYDFADMKVLYKEAALVVSRGGTSSLFELANAEIPTIVVPLPNSMDNHQLHNALDFHYKEAMICIEQEQQHRSQDLDNCVLELWNNKAQRNYLSTNLAKLNYKNCANDIASTIYQDFLYKLSE